MNVVVFVFLLWIFSDVYGSFNCFPLCRKRTISRVVYLLWVIEHCMCVLYFRNQPLFPQSCRAHEHRNVICRCNRSGTGPQLNEAKHQGFLRSTQSQVMSWIPKYTTGRPILCSLKGLEFFFQFSRPGITTKVNVVFVTQWKMIQRSLKVLCICNWNFTRFLTLS